MKASVDIILPVYNEMEALPASIERLVSFLNESFSNPWRIVIADNASTDGTGDISKKLCENYPGVSYHFLSQKGRGRALREVWLDSTADIVSYMDIDLSTALNHFPELIQLVEDGAHIAIGSRLSNGSSVSNRSFKRELISRIYNGLIRVMFLTPFDDAQCGFKALTRETAQEILPNVKNNQFFFDTELLIIASKRGYAIKQVPVKWVDDPGTTVNVSKNSADSMKGLLRLRFGGIPQVSGPDNVATQA